MEQMFKKECGNAIDVLGGAVDLCSCPNRRYRLNRWRCDCGKCIVCGHQKHTAIHGPFYGQPPGSKPYGHEYKPPIDLCS